MESALTPEEIIAQLAATPTALAMLVADATDARLDSAAEGEWPVRVVLAHLRDEESIVGRLRIERMLAEIVPEFALFDPEPWERGRSRERDRKEILLADFALQRQATLGLLRSLRPAEWARTGHHPKQGTVTIATWATYWLNHDANHLGQVERLLGETLSEVRARRARPG